MVLGDRAGVEAPDVTHLDAVLCALRVYRYRILTAIRTLHPLAGCLPVPELRVPGDLVEFAPPIAALDDVLDRACRHDAMEWADAFRDCPHLPMEAAVAINALMHRWRSLLIATAPKSEVDDHWFARYARDDLARRYEQPDVVLATASCVRQFDHSITGTNLRDLQPGDMFSTDAGLTWQACADQLPEGRTTDDGGRGSIGPRLHAANFS